MVGQVGIYKITNTQNGKVYIGKSLLLKYRFKKHLWSLKKQKHSNKHLQAAWNKYGDVFWFDILELCGKDKVNEREKFYINKFDSTNPSKGYNKTKGGDGLLATPEIKAKISKTLMGRTHTEERKRNQSNAQLGKKRSNQHKKAIGVSLLKPVTQFTKEGGIVNQWDSIKQINELLGYDITCISRCCNNKQKTSYGFIWEFTKHSTKQ